MRHFIGAEKRGPWVPTLVAREKFMKAALRGPKSAAMFRR